MILVLILTVHLLNQILTPNSPYVMSIAPVVGAALISSAAGLLGGLFNRNSQEKYNDRMIRLQQETNQMNYRMNQENNEYNRRLAIEMFNLENQYNDPKNQMARLRAAGINPFVAAGGSNIGQVEGRADTVPAQQPIAMQSPGQGTSAPVLDFASPIAQLAQAVGSIAQARKTGVETHQLEELFDTVSANLKNDVYLKSEQLLATKWQNTMNQLYGEKRISKEVRQLDAAFDNIYQGISESNARIESMKFQNALNDIEKQLKGTELERFKILRPYLDGMFRQELENARKTGIEIDSRAAANRASAVSAYASAEQARAGAEQIRKLMPLLIRGQALDNFYKGRQIYNQDLNNAKQIMENYESIRSIAMNLRSKMLANSSSAIAIDLLLEQLQQAKVNSRWQEAEKISDMFVKILGALNGSGEMLSGTLIK